MIQNYSPCTKCWASFNLFAPSMPSFLSEKECKRNSHSFLIVNLGVVSVLFHLSLLKTYAHEMHNFCLNFFCVFAEVFYLIHIQDVLVFVWIGSNYCTEYYTYTRQPSRPRLFRLLFLLVIRHYIQ